MEIAIGKDLQTLVTAPRRIAPGVRHDGRATPHLVSGVGAVLTVLILVVEGVGCAHLMRPLVDQVVGLELEALGLADSARDPLALHAGRAGDSDAAGETAAAPVEHVADVVVRRLDHGVEVLLVLENHLARVTARVRLLAGIGVDDFQDVLLRQQDEADGEIPLIDRVGRVDGGDDLVERPLFGGGGVGLVPRYVGGVLGGRRDRGAKDAEGRPQDRHRRR